jgi:hypothetical protein
VTYKELVKRFTWKDMPEEILTFVFIAKATKEPCHIRFAWARSYRHGYEAKLLHVDYTW